MQHCELSPSSEALQSANRGEETIADAASRKLGLRKISQVPHEGKLAVCTVLWQGQQLVDVPHVDQVLVA